MMLSMKSGGSVTQLGLFNEPIYEELNKFGYDFNDDSFYFSFNFCRTLLPKIIDAGIVLEEVVSNAGKQEYSAVTIGYLLSAPLAKQIIVNYYDLKSYYDMQKPLTGGISYLFENVKGTQIKFTGLNIYNAHDYLQTYTQVLNKKGIKYDWADYNKLTILVD